MNEFWVGLQGDDIVFLRPLPSRLTHEQALKLSVDLALMLGVNETEWAKAYTEEMEKSG